LATLAEVMPLPPLLRALALFDFVTAGFPILVASCAVALAVSGVPGTTLPSERALLLGLAAVFASVAGLILVVAVGLLRRRPWARVARIALACPGLLLVPFGTVVSALVLGYLLQPGIRVLYSGAVNVRLNAQEAAQLERVTKVPRAVVVAAYACACIVGVLLFTIAVALGLAWSRRPSVEPEAAWVGPPNKALQLTKREVLREGALRAHRHPVALCS
jgi:hypothetical protein